MIQLAKILCLFLVLASSFLISVEAAPAVRSKSGECLIFEGGRRNESSGKASDERADKELGKQNARLAVALKTSLKGQLLKLGEIPEDPQEVIRLLALSNSWSIAQAEEMFGPGRTFTSVNELLDSMISGYSKDFARIIDRRFFNQERKQLMLKALREAEDILVFDLAADSPIANEKEVLAMAKSLGAPILVAPDRAEVGLLPYRFSRFLAQPNVHVMVDREIRYSSDVVLLNHGSLDRTVDPTTGLEQLYDAASTVIVFSPRVIRKPTASGAYDFQSGTIMTTGSICEGNYSAGPRSSGPQNFRAERAAELNQSLVVMSRRYRQPMVAALTDGAAGMGVRRALVVGEKFGNPAGIFDLGRIYTEKGPKRLPVIPAIVFGDFHYPATDPMFLKSAFDAIVEFGIIERNPRFGRPGELEYRPGPVRLGALILHDGVDGAPFNGHLFNSLIARAKLDASGKLDVVPHFKDAVAPLNLLAKVLNTKIIIPPDNHGHDWLIKALQEGAIAQGRTRPSELSLILRLMQETIEQGGNPYQRIFSYYGIDTENVIFLSPDTNYRIGQDLQDPKRFGVYNGVEVGQHSQYGVNGAKAISLKSLLSAYSANITGHTHGTAENGQAKKVGTITPIRQDYHRGPSTSSPSIGIVYSETAIQILPGVRGSFIPNSQGQPPEKYFPDMSFPMVVPAKTPTQWNELPQ